MFVPLTPTLQQAAQVPQMRKHGAELYQPLAFRR